jgi:hypothetical protein
LSFFTRLVRINIAMLIFVSSAFGDVPEELRNMVLTGDMNGRSSVDFSGNANNVAAFVPKGTRGTVLEVRKLSKTKSFGVKMKVTELSSKPSNAKNSVTKDQEIWVYFSSTKANWLKFRDADGSVVQDPEVALTAQAKRDGEALPAVPGTLKHPQLPTAEEVIRDSAPSEDPNLAMNDRSVPQGDWCPNYPCSKGPSFNDKNIKQVEDVVKMMPAKETESAPIKQPTKEVPPKAKPKVETPIERSPKTEHVASDGKWSAYSEITEWENGVGNKLAVHAVRNASGFRGDCYRKVKRYALANKLVDGKYLPGGHARDGVRDLLALNDPKNKKKKAADSEYEWVNLLEDARYKDKIKSPADVPHGAIIVSWNGDRASSGDIQVRNAKPPKIGYVSDGYSPRTINEQPAGRRAARKGKPYKMTGVMVKIKKNR